MPLLNVDERVLIVDATGAAMGTSGNPLFTAAAAAPGTTNVQGVQAAGAAITENPVLIAGQNSGNVKLLALDASGNPTANQGTANGAGANSWPIQGVTGAGNAVAGNPNVIGGRNGAGNAAFIGGDNNGIFAQGAAGAGAAVAGNPLVIGGRDGSGNAQYVGGNNVGLFVHGGAVENSSAASLNPLLIGGKDGSGNSRGIGAQAQSVDGASNGLLGLNTQGFSYDSNGTLWDRHRNNVDVTLLASASRNTTQTSADITTFNLSGITVILNCTAGSGTITLTINGKDPASGVYYNLLTGTAVTSTSTNVYRIMPGLPAVANKDVNAYLPRTIQIVLTSNATALTYSAGYTLHNP